MNRNVARFMRGMAMALGVIELLGSDIACFIEGARENRFPAEAALTRLKSWSARYDAALRDDRDTESPEFADIGREMFAWLDEAGWASDWETATGDRALEIRVAGRRDDRDREAALLDAPWELLASPQGPLALDALQLFVVARRIGKPGTPLAPRHGDLQLMFMAASPPGQSPLDFEAEEAAILEATRTDRRSHLIVEETGALAPLVTRLTSDEGPFEVLHLSCHGDIDQESEEPLLLLETDSGDEDHWVFPRDLATALGESPPPLIMLSACRTAERGDLATPFVRQLATRVANVVGWDGSVYDRDAIDFAACFYAELARHSRVARAAALGRLTLLRLKNPDDWRGRHWHLARVYLGPGGGGPLCAARGTMRRHASDATARTFLDKERQRVPVASRESFVGRRRALQSVLRAFRDGAPGVMIHGMGAVGKSSAAARIANRMPHESCLIFERYDALAMFDAILATLPPAERGPQRDAWREGVRQDPAMLGDTLEAWLEGPLDAAPILLIVDDLERILETPRPGGGTTGVQPASRIALGALLGAFARARTRSHFLLTSRYDFTLPDGSGGDHARDLVRVPLAPMAPRERIKQLRAAERIEGKEAIAGDDESAALLAKALSAAGGNPGLQAVLTRPILAGERAAAREALRQIGVYLDSGEPPAEIQALIAAGTAKDSDNALIVFFARLSFQTYRDALTESEARLLSAATLFDDGVPIPLAALAATGAALGATDAAVGVARLLGLGLFDDWGEIDGIAHAAVNPLARPLALPIQPTDRPNLASAAFGEFSKAWREDDGEFPANRRGLQAATLALLADTGPDELEAAVFAGAAWLERSERKTREALALIAAAHARLPRDHGADPGFLRLGAECADTLGESELLDALLERKIRPPRGLTDVEHARLDRIIAQRLIRIGRIAEAEALTGRAIATLKAAGQDRSAAIAMGLIADILYQRGELDEALRIRREEELPVYERLGDVRSRAVTMGQIADILYRRGEHDEALRIRREEQLPVFERLGDVRERAVTMGKIADILYQRGEHDEALRIRREEELPVYERLGDVRSRAVTMGQIADIREQRGELDEALRIRREEELPVYERLGDVRSRAVTMGKIADILEQRGEHDEALSIRREEQLPVFERLGDVRSRAVTMGQIADILYRRGELDEALRIRREEQLPVYERLGDVRSRSVTLHKIASALIESGGIEQGRIQEIFEALFEAYQIANQIGLPDGIAFVGIELAQVIAICGLTDEALAILDVVDAAFAKLGNAEGRANVTELRIRFGSQD